MSVNNNRSLFVPTCGASHLLQYASFENDFIDFYGCLISVNQHIFKNTSFRKLINRNLTTINLWKIFQRYRINRLSAVDENGDHVLSVAIDVCNLPLVKAILKADPKLANLGRMPAVPINRFTMENALESPLYIVGYKKRRMDKRLYKNFNQIAILLIAAGTNVNDNPQLVIGNRFFLQTIKAKDAGLTQIILNANETAKLANISTKSLINPCLINKHNYSEYMLTKDDLFFIMKQVSENTSSRINLIWKKARWLYMQNDLIKDIYKSVIFFLYEFRMKK